MIRLETQEDVERARECLRRHSPEALIEFLLSLTGAPGPLGEQIRTFIGGDDVDATVMSLRQRIRDLATASQYTHRYSAGREIGMTLDLIVDSVERLVMARDPRSAFEVLVALFEADAAAMENCGEHDWEIACAYQRAAAAMAEVAPHIPAAEVAERVRALMKIDAYGVRAVLSAVLSEGHPMQHEKPVSPPSP